MNEWLKNCYSLPWRQVKQRRQASALPGGGSAGSSTLRADLPERVACNRSRMTLGIGEPTTQESENEIQIFLTSSYKFGRCQIVDFQA